MNRMKASAYGLPLLLATGCAQLGIKSVPWPTSTDVHDRQAMDFLRDSPEIDRDLGAGLHTKPMLEDGQLVGLSASGGGARAAAFTLGVLTELQKLETASGTTVLDSIDFISANSGGSWAVAAYLSDRANSKDPNYSLNDRATNTLIPKFVAMSKGRVPCWSEAMETHLFDKQTYRDIYSAANPVRLPRAYFNAALLPAHSPFVFTDSFILHYEVERFGSCGNHWMPAASGLADLPFGYAAAASGTVPGFYHAYASTRLCEDTNPVSSPSFCHGNQKGRRKYLRIADGGLYDNIGYKTAYEVMLQLRDTAPAARKAMILVNSNTSTDFKTVKPSHRSKTFLATTAINGLFAVQDSTFERLYRPMFKSLGVDKPLLLDFYGTANFQPEQIPLLKGLDELADYALHDVRCYVDEKLIRAQRRKSGARPLSAAESAAQLQARRGDCLSENFYRTGTLGKTTYLADARLFKIHWQLGRLSVRMQRKELLEAVN